MGTWIDNQGTSHTLEINGVIAKKLRTQYDLDLMPCLVKLDAVEGILQRLSESPELQMACCACVEGIADKDLETYYELWDGDAFESAPVALLQAIANFFPRRPRAILHRLISKMKSATEAIGDKAEAMAMAHLESLDCISALNASLMPGNGGTESAESSGTEPSS